MCTINSLDNRCSLLSISSLRTVLVFLALCYNQDSSGASKSCHSSMVINVMAPADITINIGRSSGCDTLIDLPAANFTGQCAGPLSFTTYSVFTSLNTSGGTMYFTTGVFKVYFTVSDNCGMTGIDSMNVSVFDASLPNVVCNPQQTMNLPSNGFLDAPAWIFDGGSFDTCGVIYFKVKRMFAPSINCANPTNPGNAFDDVVRFCCDDVDSGSIMVILRVYDVSPGFGPVNDSLLYGRYVECMVEAIVNDKIPPDIHCPSDITVLCGADIDSAFAASQDPLIVDNCSAVSDTDFIISNLDACGSGTIIRTFIATDSQGQFSSCSQVITVTKQNTFNGLDTAQLKWPTHKIVFACRIDPDTINAGIPIINEDACANVLTAFRDEKYNFDRGGVCAKILRYWEVIDWCIYNPGLLPNPRIPQNGYYSYLQEIKIMDTIAPVLTGLNDTIIGIQTASCQPGIVNLPSVIASDCGSFLNISIYFEIDYNIDGQIDLIGQGDNASGMYPLGRHLIKFFANDSCHNTGTLEIILEVVDTKPPNALAIFGLSSSLLQMQAGPMVSIIATLFNAKSTDNCTKESELRFSFSSDINDTIRVFTCDSIGFRIINLVVWDQAGNSSEVTTFITIQDVNGLCPTSIKNVQVSGQILTIKDQLIQDVDVYLKYDKSEHKSITDTKGYFNFNSIPKSKIVRLESSCNKNFVDGISTADIIKIQRHILGLENFKSPWDILAADVDLNQRITSKDILWLRKLILGQVIEIPNQDSYLFLNKKFTFSIPQNPFIEIDSSRQIFLETIKDINDIELLAIKLGDVNQSFISNGFQFDNPKELDIKYQISHGVLEIFPAEKAFIQGFQFELLNKDLCLDQWREVNSSLENWTNSNFNVDAKKIRVSYSSNQEFLIDPKVPLLTIPIRYIINDCTPTIFLSPSFTNEMYQNNEVLSIRNIELNNWKNPNDAEWIDIHPNPFHDQLQIIMKMNEETTIHMEVYSLDQKKIYLNDHQLKKGSNTIFLKKENLTGSGIFILHIRSNNTSKVYKIINE